jgi:uncharacterized phage protein gp47/JayE
VPGPYVTAAGLSIPTVESLLEDLVTDQRELIDPLINTDAEEVLGQLNGTFASALREAYEVIEVAYNAFDPDAVEDSRVDTLVAITGSRRAPATKSRFTGTRKLTVDLNAATTLPIGTMFEVEGDPGVRFVTLAEDDGTALTSTTAGLYAVAAEAETAGAVTCNANTLTVITTPVVGLNSVTNDSDAIVGTDVDTDAEALARREDELDALGSGTPDAIRAHLLAYEVDGDKPILEVTVLVNDDDTVDDNGLPGHSIECIVYDGLAAEADDDAIAQLIWNHKPAGTRAVGSSSGTALDKKGNTQTVYFTRPTLVGIDVDVTINTDDDYGSASTVETAWKAFVDALPTGEASEVKFSKSIQAILAVAGVTGIETIRLRRHLGTYLAAFEDLPLTAREKSFADASSFYVTVTVA